MFTVEEIAHATGGTVFGNAAGVVSGVSTDSRRIRRGELFVALKGGRFDGHEFIAAAAAAGVGVFLADPGWIAANTVPPAVTVIVVKDTLRGFGDLAAYHRRRFVIPVIGVTGSNGKTTVKEMLQLNGGHHWAVLEMGMSEPGEIDRLAEMAGPQVGIITNALPAHLESMGSLEAVARPRVNFS
jgi:UDP-N-acetylmuramoyl-tripeptide--D-alanyl-D-alanine ligase